jgi:hypothetical protein
MSTTTFIKRVLGPTQVVADHSPALTLRFAVPADAAAIERLAQLDSRHVPRGQVLVAEVGGELWAAISVDDRQAIADPFRPTGELVALLVERARQLRRSQRRQRHGLPRAWPHTSYDRAAIG